MSVILLGMEMPHKCLECRFNTDEIACTAATLEQSKEAYYEAIKNGTSHEEEMFKNCPLRPLPVTHGPLIDKTALLNAKWDWCDAEEAIRNMPVIVEGEGKDD